MTNVGNRRRKSKSPSTSTSFVLLLVASLLFALTAAGAPDPTQPPRRQRLTTLDLAALEAPAPLPSPAALGKRYLLSPLSVGPSHAFVIARVARELVSRGASVLLLCPGSMRPFFDVPPPGVKTLSIEVGRGGKRGGGEGAEEEGGREPTEADFEDESVKWRTVHYNTSGELMRRLPALMKLSRGNALPWQNFHLFADGLAAECDEVIANERLLKAARLFKPDVFIGDLMESCFVVLGERAFSSSSSSPSIPIPPRVAIHNGPVITPMFDAAGFDLLGRGWGIPAQLASVPTFGAGLVPPFSLSKRVLNLAHFLGNSAHDYFRMRPVLHALHRRHGVPFKGDGRSSQREILAAKQRDALLVLQGDWAIDWPRPMPPATLVAGPVMPGPAKPLPEELRNWIEEAQKAKEQIIYTALGSTFQLTPDKSKEIVRALHKAAPRARIMIKLSDLDLPAEAERELREELSPDRGPQRLLISKWLPQNDLLGAPGGAVSLYLTHGGISSLSEATYHGVPVVALPQGAEQPDNAAKAQQRGFGIGLRRGAGPEELAAAVAEVLEDKGGKFSAAARAAAVRMRAGRPPAAAVIAAAIERVAVASGAFERDSSGSSSSSSNSSSISSSISFSSSPPLPDPGWRMLSADQPWAARHCLDAGAVLLAVVLGPPLLLLWGLRVAVSKVLSLNDNKKKSSSSSSSSRSLRSSNGAAEHAKLS